MNADRGLTLPIFQRRTARRLAHFNGGLWAVGNGMISGHLVVYLAIELGVPGIGLGISLIRAAPQLAGLLRAFAPALIGRLANRKRFCIGSYLLSTLVLLGLPLASVPGVLPTANAALAAVVGLWCLYHLLEYLGTVALWAWLADLVPQRIRGRFVGQRERWMVAGQAVSMLATAAFGYCWNLSYPKESYPEMVWIGYAIPAALGTLVLTLSLVPLAAMPGLTGRSTARRRAAWSVILSPLADRRFLALLGFGIWFGMFGGLVQAAQAIYPARVLAIPLFAILALQTVMRAGQLAISPWLGRLADRYGNRPMMAACVPIVASGTLFYLAASRSEPHWFAGAWLAWIAYAGLNVGLPNLNLKLAPADSRASYIACYFGVTGALYALSTVAGGLIVDRFRDGPLLQLPGVSLDCFQTLFLLAWLGRTVGVLFLMAIDEPQGSEP